MDVISLYGPIIEFEGWMFLQAPGFNLEEELGEDLGEKLRNAKGEKKKYFVLVRAATDQGKESVTLSWYNAKPAGGKKKKNKAQGSIKFVPSNSCRIIDNILVEIYTGARNYYLRAVADIEDAEARTEAAAWEYAISFGLSKIKGGASGGSFRTKAAKKNHNPLIKPEHSKKEGGAERRHQTRAPLPSILMDSIHVPGSQESRTSFESLDLEKSSDKGFYQLWKVHGLDGYNTIIHQFGPFLIDVERIKQHVECRYTQIIEQCKILETNRIQVNEPILIVQKSTKDALKAVYDENNNRLDTLAPVAVHVKNEVLQPLESLVTDAKEELSNIVNHFGKYSIKLERTRKAVIVATKDVKDREREYIEAQQVAQNIPNRSGGSERGKSSFTALKDRRAANALRKVSFKFSKKGAPKNEESMATLQEYADALANAKKNRVDFETELDSWEKKIGQNMKNAMDKLENLQVRILTEIKTILLGLANAEAGLFSKLAEEFEAGGELQQMVINVNPEDDMTLTTDYLLKAAKKDVKV